MISVRQARKEDLNILYEFEQGVIHAERPFDITLKEGPVHYYEVAEMIEATHIRVVVAESGNQVIGSGYARIEDAKHYANHKQYAYLGFMFVRPEFRGQGVNNLIIEALKEWAISRDIFEIRLDVYDENEKAIRAYEKAGFSRYMLCMRLGLTK